MGDGHALGGAGRARRVHDAAQVIGRRGHEVDGVLLAELLEVVEAHDLHVRVRGLELLDVLRVDLVLRVPDDVLDLGGDGEHVGQGGQEVGVEEDGLGLGGDHGVAQALLAERVVGRDYGHALGAGGVGHGEPVLAGGGVDVDAVASNEAELAQTGAELVGQALVVGVRDVLVRAHLEEGPRLLDLALLAVDHLLDHLLVLVGADELARAHALGVAELGDAGADEVVDGVDVILGAQEKGIDSERVAADGGLALDGLLAGHLDREGRLRGHARDEMYRLRHGGRRSGVGGRGERRAGEGGGG